MPHIRDLVAEDLGIAPAHRQRDLWEVLDQPDQIIPMTGPTSHPRQSPWGRCDNIEVIAPGMVRVHTAGHGGIHLDSWRTKMLPPAFRRSAQQWFEEDCACAIPMVAFHREFTERQVRGAIATLRNTFPDLYEEYFQATIPEGSSYEKDKQLFTQRHAGSLLGAAAWNAGNARDRFGIDVPEGEVLLVAYLGSNHPHLNAPTSPRSPVFVCVSATKYDERGRFPYVIQTSDRRLTAAELTPAMQEILASRS